jgi:hypothetical protein
MEDAFVFHVPAKRAYLPKSLPTAPPWNHFIEDACSDSTALGHELGPNGARRSQAAGNALPFPIYSTTIYCDAFWLDTQVVVLYIRVVKKCLLPSVGCAL